MGRSPHSIAHLIPVVTPSAVGTHTLLLHRACVARGLESVVYAQEVHDDLGLDVRPAAEFFASEPRRDDSRITVLQFASPWEQAQHLLSRPEPLVVNYHNITPPELIDEFWPQAAPLMRHGLFQLRQLAGRADLAIADSAFNAMQLRECGYNRVAIASLMMPNRNRANSPGDFANPRRTAAQASNAAPRINLLFVGRIAPNKAQHELVNVVGELHRRGVDARLDLVGKVDAPDYARHISETITEAELGDSITVHGHVSDAERDALYKNADVFVCLSDHEGFCAPIIEAFSSSIPVVAFHAGAVSETAGDGAVLVKSKDVATVATAILGLMADDKQRSVLVANGLIRAEYFSLQRATDQFFDALVSAFGPLGETPPTAKSTLKKRLADKAHSSVSGMAWTAMSPLVGRLDRIEQRLEAIEAARRDELSNHGEIHR